MTPSKNPLYPGFNVLLMGPSGTGKTYSLHTLLDTGMNVFCLFLEPGLETLIGSFSDKGKPIPENLHWHYLQPKSHGFGDLLKSADSIGKFDLAGLARLKDINRSKNNQMTEVFKILNDFPDQRTGKNFGPVDSWENNSVLVIDSLSALNRIAMEMVIGTKPVKDMSDWGIAQGMVMSVLQKLTAGCNCHLVIIAHVEREVDLLLGGVKLMVSALGKAITGQIPQYFSDVILATRENTAFYWDTANSQADVKSRNLPMSQKLAPDFGAIYKTWESRMIAASPKGPAA